MKNKIPPPIILLLSGFIAWLVARSEYAHAVAIPFELPIAILLAVVGFLIAGSALRQFRSAETTVNPLQPGDASALVDGGIFARTRNPMYLGLCFVLCGWLIWLQSATNIVVLIAFIVFITEFQIKPEEKALQNLFGQKYLDYCERVRRWV